jgi:hypothetical protein
MFGGVKGFEPVGNYAKETVENRKFQYGKDVQCSSELLALIVTAEQIIQEFAQLEDQWKEEHHTLLKNFSQGEDIAKIHECEEVIEGARNWGDWGGRLLYHLENRLPRGTLKKSYDKVREDPTWYLRKELVKDCAARGGCCEKRRLNSDKKRGIGHCTLRCICCDRHRGTAFSQEQEDELRTMMQECLYDPDPTYLLEMADAYFLPPETPGLKEKFVRAWKQMKRAFEIK